jgi:hypothetical protein
MAEENSKNNLKFGESYLLVGESSDEAYDIFLKHVSGDKKGLLVWRTHPKKGLSELKGKDVKTIWITNISTESEHLQPHELEQLSYNIEKFMMQNKRSVVLMLSIEYLVSFNTFKDILHLIQTMRDLAAEHEVLFLAYVGKDTLSKQEEGWLKQELIPLNGKEGS